MAQEIEDPAQIFEASLIARQKPMLAATEGFCSPIQKFYEGTTAFITGGSGFLGKQLIEKLLRATKMTKIYVLLRPKKGKSIQERVATILEDPVYDLLKENHPDFASKIVAVEGNVAELRLGLSEENWKMITDEVDIIFHMAATTRFDETLRVATMINVRGTMEALKLGKECKNIRSFIHVSTAYSHACDNVIGSEVLEDFYRSPIDPDTLLGAVDTMNNDKLNAITASLITKWPNTYSFAKAVAEEVVRTKSDGLPICVVRPAIVICAEREPKPGWLDMSNVFGASGIILGPGLGLMRVIYGSDSVRIGLIPVDYVNNSLIAAGWEVGRKRTKEIKEETSKEEIKEETCGKEIKIYTITSSTRNRAKWGELRVTLTGAARDFYSPSIVWIPNALLTSNKWAFVALTWLLHFIPAYVFDGVCFVLGKQRIFVKLYQKMFKMSIALSYFTLNDWNFVDKNTADLYDKMAAIDKEIFDFDVHKINWVEYMITWCLGLRRFIIKDGLKNTYYARKKAIVFSVLNYIVMPLYFYALYKVVAYVLFAFVCIVKFFVQFS